MRDDSGLPAGGTFAFSSSPGRAEVPFCGSVEGAVPAGDTQLIVMVDSTSAERCTRETGNVHAATVGVVIVTARIGPRPPVELPPRGPEKFAEVVLPGFGGAEPGVASFGPQVYVQAPGNLDDNGSQTPAVWRSGDGGVTFAAVPTIDPMPDTALDQHLAVAPDDGTAYWVRVSSNGDVLTLFHQPQGRGAWRGPAVLASAAADRPWITAGAHGLVYVIYRSLPSPMIEHVLRSTDYGATFTELATLVLDRPESAIAAAAAPPLADPRDANLLSIFFLAQPSGANSGGYDEVRLTQSDDGGHTWSERNVGFAANVGVFPTAAVDEHGDLYTAVSSTDSPGLGPYTIDVWASADQGRTFRGPYQVDQLAAFPTNVLPWIAARRGHLDAAWYTSTCTTCNDESATWTVAYARSDNVFTAPTPTFTESRASSGIVHRGAVCRDGPTCSAGTRSLLDFIGLDIDHHGRPQLAWTDTMGAQTRTVFAHGS